MSPPRIVVLDGYALNPGDLSWAALAELGEYAVHERSSEAQILGRAAGASALLTNKAVLSRHTLEELAALRYVGVLATGTNVVDLDAARALGVTVTNVPGYGADSVAEHTLALMLEATKHIGPHTRAVRSGAWAAQPDFSFSVAPLSLLHGKTLGIIGFGAIGRRVTELALAFGMNLLVARHGDPALDPAARFSVCELDELFERADFVSLHCPLTAATRHLVDAQRLARMKPSAILINTARGGLVEEAALEAALFGGRIRAAYLDVLEREPPVPDHPLTRLSNCFVTPHIAWASVEARARLLEIAVANLRAFFQGSPSNVVA